MLVTTQWPLKRAVHLTSLVWVCVLWLPWKLNRVICAMISFMKFTLFWFKLQSSLSLGVQLAISQHYLDHYWTNVDPNKQRVLMHGHQGWNVRHGLCHIYIRYVYIWVVYSFCLFCCLFIIVRWWYVWCIEWASGNQEEVQACLVTLWLFIISCYSLYKTTLGLLCSWFENNPYFHKYSTDFHV